jgi:protein-S-isoprenylcysteine O-methyltransferase Ste14
MPGLPNLLGLAITGGGVFLLLWCIKLHVTRYSTLSPVDSYPPFLLVGGPYRFSRNPMYIADVAIWLGWALFYGSIPVLLASLCFAGFLAFVHVPSEERQLLARFSDEYQLYKSSVPRWVGRRHRPAP